MKNTFGSAVSITIFGESHGCAVGAILDGLTPGIPVDEEFIAHRMNKRRSVASVSTARRESDEVKILSGVINGKTTGTPITFVIENKNTKSADYANTATIARPGHADYTAYEKYHGYSDTRGGGHFSGRVTAGITAAGAVALGALKTKGILVGAHILRILDVSDSPFSDNDAELKEEITSLTDKLFPTLSENAKDEMMKKIEDARADGDSVGGIVECAVTGIPAGVGEPWFDSIESNLSHILFAIPAIKGVEFGEGFAMTQMYGSQANDAYAVSQNGKIVTATNNNGGILGGISSGMPIKLKCAVKPTPSIYKPQKSVDFLTHEERELIIKGRHDPAIVHRAAVVIESAVAIALCDMLQTRYGDDYFLTDGKQ